MSAVDSARAWIPDFAICSAAGAAQFPPSVAMCAPFLLLELIPSLYEDSLAKLDEAHSELPGFASAFLRSKLLSLFLAAMPR